MTILQTVVPLMGRGNLAGGTGLGERALQFGPSGTSEGKYPVENGEHVSGP